MVGRREHLLNVDRISHGFLPEPFVEVREGCCLFQDGLFARTDLALDLSSAEVLIRNGHLLE